MLRINVLVAFTSTDAKAEVIAAQVAKRPDMSLVGDRFMHWDRVDAFLEAEPPLPHVAVILLGNPLKTREIAEHWVAKRADVVVMLVDVVDDVIRIQGITLRDPHLDAILTALHDIVERVGPDSKEARVVQIELASPPSEVSGDANSEVGPVETHGEEAAPGTDACPPASNGASGPPPHGHDAATPPPEEAGRPLLEAATNWLHHLLRDAIDRVPSDAGDVHGLLLTRATLLKSLDAASLRTADDRPGGLDEASERLDKVLCAALRNPDQYREPLAVFARTVPRDTLEFRLVVLTLAPEIDVRFQRCLGFLLDDMGRRVGTFGLYAMLLGANNTIREKLAKTGRLDRWLVFDGPLDQRAAADEPLRIDPFLARWVLGETDTLGHDPRARRATRRDPWLGAALLTSPHLRTGAKELVERLKPSRGSRQTPWLLLDGTDAAGWRAIVELGATASARGLIRVEPLRLAGVDPGEVEEAGRRVARWSRLTGQPLIVDVTKAGSVEGAGDESGWLRLFLAAIAALGAPAAVISEDEARGIRLMGSTAFVLIPGNPLDGEAMREAVREAAKGADVWMSEDQARVVASRYPLRVDGLEHAMRLARSRPLDYAEGDPRLERFMTAAKEIVADGMSHFADRLEPVFDLDDVVLPQDRKAQLLEIVDNVRFAHQVLEEWKFGARLPYGRGVTALFFGSSGVGKTTAAMAIARRLNVQLLRLDLSRVVSKYIGETEKNLDRVFCDAERSGAAILIDEADALLGKRSEVKDAHDRYANIEVAFLLQRMESFHGICIATSNSRQGLDQAFLRRLRFIIDFPRPDADAREKIWRLCLPDASHTLDDAAFRQLARKIDVTGGHIRQITLRAAFIAAAAGSLIDLEHIAQAARAELAKLGMPAVDLDLAAARRAA